MNTQQIGYDMKKSAYALLIKSMISELTLSQNRYTRRILLWLHSGRKSDTSEPLKLVGHAETP
jgi:hypothetical protein